MANSKTFLTIPAGQLLGTEVGYFEREIDFAKENLDSGDSMDVLALPKGAVPIQCVLITKKADTNTTATLKIDVASAALALRAAAVLGAVNSADIGTLTASKVLEAEDTVRLTAGVTDFVDAQIVVGVAYIVSDACRN